MLTGTPLQNDLEELQNLLSFLLPDVFNADVAAQLADEQACAAGLIRWNQLLCAVRIVSAQLSSGKAPHHSFPASQGMLLLVAHGLLTRVTDFAAMCDDVVPRASTA